jgi:hypothetical protein
MDKIANIIAPNRRLISICVKAIILLILAVILYVQLFVRHDISDLSGQFHNSVSLSFGWVYFISVLVLMPVNWLLESIKWDTLVSKFQSFGIKKSIFSVLSGVSMAIMTPGRIGEYGGRLVGIQSQNRPKAILANLISSLSQNIINLGLGLVMALWFFNTYIEIQQSVFLSMVFASTLIICLLLLAFFRIDLLDGLLAYLPKYKWVIKIKDSVSSFSTLDNQTLFYILGLSFIRYSVYLSQYVLLIFFFGVTDQLVPAILGVSTLFFLQSNLPLPPALSVLARGEMAIFLWSVFSSNVLGIVAATFSLWIINLVIPAVFGGIIISQADLFEE